MFQYVIYCFFNAELDDAKIWKPENTMFEDFRGVKTMVKKRGLNFKL